MTAVQLKSFPSIAFFLCRKNAASLLPIQSSGDSQKIRKASARPGHRRDGKGLGRRRQCKARSGWLQKACGAATAHFGPSLSCGSHLWEGHGDNLCCPAGDCLRDSGRGSRTARKCLFFTSPIRKAPAQPPSRSPIVNGPVDQIPPLHSLEGFLPDPSLRHSQLPFSFSPVCRHFPQEPG